MGKMLIAVALAFLIVPVGDGVAWAKGGGKGRMACANDVARFCPAGAHWTAKCLSSHVADLEPACRTMVERWHRKH